MVDEICSVIPGKQVIVQRLRENAKQHFRRKTICYDFKKLAIKRCVQKLYESDESLFSRIDKANRLIHMTKQLQDYILRRILKTTSLV